MARLSKRQKRALLVALVCLRDEEKDDSPSIVRKCWVNPISLEKRNQGHHENLIRYVLC